jgi:[ribosomal protein S5]-alanine N-acetyltransferase
MESERRFPVIETQRLKLRKPLQKDARALVKISHDTDVMQYYGMAALQNRAEALDEIQWFNRLFARAEGIRWVITETGSGDYIGDIGLHHYMPEHARAEIGFKLAKAHWHQGLMSEALGAALTYGFAAMALNRIEAVVDPRNTACLALLKKAGFQREGLLREYEHEAAGFVDLVMLGMLRRDWPALPGS